jgi:GcrA cell cycle regulator
MDGDWRDEDIALLKRLWAKGETAARIAEKLGGLSRSAVLGKIFRLRLGPGAKQNPGKAPAKAAAKTSQRQQPARRRGVAPPPPAAKARYSKTLFDLTNRCCRWPFKRPGTDKYFFCGAEEADLENGIPYCARHMKRAYLVPPPLAVRQRKPLRAA